MKVTMMKQTIHNILLVVGLLILACLLFGAPLMVLWNWLMPTIFGLPEITFWQACGLNILSAILFRSTIKTNKD
jgi:hypothetical protein